MYFIDIDLIYIKCEKCCCFYYIILGIIKGFDKIEFGLWFKYILLQVLDVYRYNVIDFDRIVLIILYLQLCKVRYYDYCLLNIILFVMFILFDNVFIMLSLFIYISEIFIKL